MRGVIKHLFVFPVADYPLFKLPRTDIVKAYIKRLSDQFQFIFSLLLELWEIVLLERFESSVRGMTKYITHTTGKVIIDPPLASMPRCHPLV